MSIRTPLEVTATGQQIEVPSVEDAKAMIAAGANRLGTSAGVAIAKGETSKSTY